MALSHCLSKTGDWRVNFFGRAKVVKVCLTRQIYKLLTSSSHSGTARVAKVTIPVRDVPAVVTRETIPTCACRIPQLSFFAPHNISRQTHEFVAFTRLPTRHVKLTWLTRIATNFGFNVKKQAHVVRKSPTHSLSQVRTHTPLALHLYTPR